MYITMKIITAKAYRLNLDSKRTPQKISGYPYTSELTFEFRTPPADW